MADESDHGAKLRSLYATEGGVHSIFSRKVADYIASRPDYPNALFQLLQQRCAPSPAITVADVGAGSGLLTHGLLKCGYRVIAVEPNADMRHAADQWLGGTDGYRSVDGGAEAMPLPAASIDLITVAQAFHWFDVAASRTEFLRVLKPGARVALIWNDRVLEDPLHVALDKIFGQFGGDKRTALVEYEDRLKVLPFFGAQKPEEFSWPNQHTLDESGLLSLVLSRSYMPPRESPEGSEVVEGVRHVFERFAIGGWVTVPYRIRLYLGAPR
jgi:ubiquinone/menaquinone biosynthesis C-methylase UbiE